MADTTDIGRFQPLQPIDAITLSHLAADWRRMLHGARVSKIVHPHRHEFLITFWGYEAYPPRQAVLDTVAWQGVGQEDSESGRPGQPRGEFNQLYINLNPEFCCCILIDPKEKPELIRTTLHQPTALCMLLRKLLNNAKVVDVATLPNERVLNITFENFNELGNRVQLVLSLELMGKHSNMILYDAVQENILAVSHSVSERMSRHRELTIGLPYALPPRDPAKQSLWQWTEEQFAQWAKEFFEPAMASGVKMENAPTVLAGALNRQFSGLGKLFAQQVIEVIPLDDLTSRSLYRLLWRLHQGDDIHPNLSADRKRFFLLPLPGGTLYSSVQAMLHAYWTHHVRQRRIAQLRVQLLRHVDGLEKRRARQEAQLKPMDERDIGMLQSAGHLILTAYNSGRLPPRPVGAEIVLDDEATGEQVMLTIDPHLDWPENAQLFYRRAKKAKARQSGYEDAHRRLDDERQYLQELALLIEQADSLSDLLAIEEGLSGYQSGEHAEKTNRNNHDRLRGNDRFKAKGKSGQITSRQNNKPERKGKPTGVLTLVPAPEVQLLVGRTSQANAEIVGRLGKPDDWWFHVHQMPGSHILLKQNPSGDLSDDILLAAANLAVYFSQGRDSKNVPVIYTPLKYVRKIPDSYPGHVTYRQEKTIFITVDERLIQKLLQETREDASARMA